MRRSPFAHRSPRAPGLRAETDNAVELLLYDEVGYWGIRAREFAETLRAIDADTIHLRVNSPGGDVFDGVAMYNALRAHPAHIVTHIDGLAASIASVIALAGAEVRIAPNAFFMIHNPWGVTIGDADLHRKQADTLDKIATGAIASTYRAKTGADLETIETWMDDETWFSAEQAADAGFVDAIEEAEPAEALAVLPFDLGVYRNTPAALHYDPAAATDELAAAEWRDLEAALRDEGLSRSDAVTALSALKHWCQRDAGAPSTPPRDGVRAGSESDAARLAERLAREMTADAANLQGRVR